MSVRINPRDRVTVTNFRYNPGSSISLFSLSGVNAAATDLSDGQVLTWDATRQEFSANVAPQFDISGGTYGAAGPIDGANVHIRYSTDTAKPADGTVALSELNYSFLPDSFDATANNWVGGETLFIGDASGNPVAIGSKRIYDYADHADGVVGPNNIVITDDQGAIDQITIGQLDISGSTISVDNAGSNLYLQAGTLANIHVGNNRIINLADPIADQDAVTKAYLEQAIVDFQTTPVVISDIPPADPAEGDLWYDSNSSYRTYVWHDATQAWIDLSPNVGGDGTGLVTIQATPPADPSEGEAWFDSGTTGRTYIWDGVAWIDMNPTSAGGSSSEAHVSISDTPPADPDAGDLWYDSGATFRLFVWDKFSDVWVDASPNITTDTTHAVVSDAAPTDQKSGDFWYDTDNFTTKLWDGFAWVDVRPSDAAATTAVGLVSITPNAPATPEIGQAWLDSDGDGRTYVWDGLAWIDMAPSAGSGSSSNTVITLSASAPANPWVGQPYYDPTTTTGYIWDGATWVIFSDPDPSVDHVTFSALAPSATANRGDLWYDQINATTMVYDGVNWIDVRPQDEQPSIEISTTPPTSPLVGSAWYDADSTGRTYVWDGAAWVDLAPQAIVEPEKLGAEISPSIPLTPYTGQLWYNTNESKAYTYDGTAWVPFADPNSGVEPHVNINIVAPADPDSGDLWYETGNSALYMWTGLEWLDLHEDIVAASPAPVTISDNPPAAPDIGSAWYDADTTGRTYVWDGAAWIDMNPAAATPALIQVSATAPIAPLIGTAWYDSGSSLKTTVWDGTTWANVAASGWVSIYNTSLIGSPGVSFNPADYKSYKIQFETASTFSASGTSAGLRITAITDSGKTIELADHPIDPIEYPFFSTFEVENYFDGGTSEPSSYLLNKYNEKIITITIQPRIGGDTFQSGDVTIWGAN